MKCFSWGRWVSASVLCLAWTQAFAVDEPLPSEQVYLQELPVVLSASRLHQPLSEAPNAVTVIDREMIHATGYRNIADLFRLVPGMYVGYQDGHSPFVSYHGSTDNYARRMQVLVDGRSVYLPPFGGVDWADLPVHIDDIERIEVIRGPSAASHGANSTQGVINIITREVTAERASRVSLNKGEAGISDLSAHLAGGVGNLDYRATFASRADAGYAASALNDSSATRLGNVRANYHPDFVNSLDVRLGYSEGVRGTGMVGREPMRDFQTRANFEQLEWAHVLSQGNELKLRGIHMGRSYADTSLALAQDVIGVQRNELEMQHTLLWGTANRIVWGGGVRIDDVSNPISFATHPPVQKQVRVFAHDEWRVSEAALLNLGTMWERDGLGHSNQSPRISLNYHFTPHDTLRIGASKAYRTPVTFEEFSNTVYPPGSKQYRSLGGLQPERMLSKEIAYIGEFPALQMTLDSRLYSDQLNDLIFLDPLLDPLAGVVIGFKNLYALSIRGFENTLTYRWNEESSLRLNYAHQLMSCRASGSMTLAVFAPTFQGYLDTCHQMVPLNSGSLLWIQQVGHGVGFTLGYYYQGELQLLDALQTQTTMNRVDIRIAKSFGNLARGEGGEVALVVQNAFQDGYTEFANVPQKRNLTFDRRTYLTSTFYF